jgi:hypothetical protein
MTSTNVAEDIQRVEGRIQTEPSDLVFLHTFPQKLSIKGHDGSKG